MRGTAKELGRRSVFLLMIELFKSSFQEVSLAHPTCTSTIVRSALELDRLRPNNSTGQRVGSDLPTGMAKDVQPLKVDKLVGGEEGVDLQEISEVHHPLHIACRGLYNPAAHRRLLNVCRDCYNLFREAEVCLHVLCQIFHIFLHSHFLTFNLSYFHFSHEGILHVHRQLLRLPFLPHLRQGSTHGA